MLTRDELAASVKSGKIDTVIVALTDMQGRLIGKRVDAEYFLVHGIEQRLELPPAFTGNAYESNVQRFCTGSRAC